MRPFFRPLSILLLAILPLIVPVYARGYEALLSDVWVAALAATPEGELFVCGQTSVQRPQTRGAILIGPAGSDTADITLTKLSRSGAVLWSALMGGSGLDRPFALFRDGDGNLTIVGHTTSTNFPGLAQALSSTDQMVFVSKLDATGTNLLFTRIVSPQHVFGLFAATGDAQGNIYLLGSSYDSTIKALPEESMPYGQVVTVIKLSASGEVVFKRRFGGSSHDWTGGIAVDAQQNIYVTGVAYSSDFPVINAARPSAAVVGQSEVFVTKLSADGNELLYSVLLGGDATDEAGGIAVNSFGEAFISGTTTSPVFPADPDRQPGSGISAPHRAFVTKMGAGGSNVSRTVFLHIGQVRYFGFGPFMQVRPGENDAVIIAGTAEAGYSLVVEIDALGHRKAFPMLSACEGAAMSVNGMTIDANGRMYVAATRENLAGTGGRTIIKSFDTAPPPLARPVIVSPRSGQVFGDRESIALTVAAEDFGDSINEVSFFDGRKLIAVVTNAPFSFAWTNALRGHHSIKAIVTRSGVAIRTCPVTVTVKTVRNDEPAEAIPLKGEHAAIRGSTLGATSSAPLLPGWKDVWYSWIAPRNGTFRFRIADPAAEMVVGIGTNQNLKFRSQNLRAEAGERYHVRVAAWADVKFKLVVEPIAAPTNDDFSNRMQLIGDSISTTGSLAAATVEDGDPTNATATLWYTWAAPRDGVFTVSVSGNSSASIIVARGASQTNLIYPYLFMPRVQYFNAREGEEFSIGVVMLSLIDPFEGLGEFTLEIAPPPAAPANDNFEQRIMLAGEKVSVTNSTLGATTEPGEPKHTPFWVSSYGSVWWTWVAPSAGVYSFAVTGVTWIGSGTAVAVYRQNFPGANIAVGNLIRVSEGSSSAETVFSAEEGVTYFIAVADAGAPALVLTIQPVRPPSNDNIADAKVVSGRVALIVGNTSYGSTEAGESYVGYPPRSVWYRWIAPADGAYAISFIQDFSLHEAYVTRDENLGEQGWIASGPNDVVFQAQAGIEYRIAMVSQYWPGPFSAEIHPVQTTSSTASYSISGPASLATAPPPLPTYGCKANHANEAFAESP